MTANHGKRRGRRGRRAAQPLVENSKNYDEWCASVVRAIRREDRNSPRGEVRDG